jgi:hypothetical protein
MASLSPIGTWPNVSNGSIGETPGIGLSIEQFEIILVATFQTRYTPLHKRNATYDNDLNPLHSPKHKIQPKSDNRTPPCPHITRN